MILIFVIFCDMTVDLEHLYDQATTHLVSFQMVKDSAMQEFVSLATDSQKQKATFVFLLSKFDTKSAFERHTLKDIFKRIGDPAIPWIVNNLQYRGSDTESRSLKQSLWVLGEIGSAQIVEAVARYTLDDEWSVRSGAYTALGKSQTPGALDYILRGLDDSVSVVRKSAYYALIEIASEQELPYMLRGLHDHFYGVRYAALSGIRRMQLEERPVVTLVDDQMRDYFTIAAMDSNDVLYIFKEHFQSASPAVRKVIYDMLGESWLEQALPKETHPLLRAYLKQRIGAQEKKYQ